LFIFDIFWLCSYIIAYLFSNYCLVIQLLLSGYPAV
jgi:hypothetical protein